MAKEMTEQEELASLEEFKDLTPLQRQILFGYLESPDLDKSALAVKLGIKKSSVYSFFNSKGFEKINEELAKQFKKELLQLAIRTLKELLGCKSDMVRLAAADKILKDAGILQPDLKTLKQSNNITVVWDNDKDNGSKDKVQAASDAVKSASRLIPFQDNSGWKEMGENNFCDKRVN